jgi:LysR family transcriptional activator of glutamate synthase operon
LVELRQLRYFEAVASRGGFTRGAEHLHVAQSAVSAQIRALEAEVGAALFTRTTRRVTLTHAGELFLHRVRRALDELDGGCRDLADLAAVLSGRVAIGATAVVGTFDLPAGLARFHARYRGVALSLRSGMIAALLAQLDAGEIDLVVGPIHRDLPSRFSAHRLVDEEVVLVLPPGHRLARGRRLGLDDLRDEPFICLPASSGLRSILDELAADAGFEARVQFEAHSPTSIRDLVAAGLGVAVLARSAADGPGAPISVRSLHPAVAHPPIGLIHHRHHRLTIAAQACRRHIIEMTAKAAAGPG